MEREERGFYIKDFDIIQCGLVLFVDDEVLKSYKIWKLQCKKKTCKECSNLKDKLYK